MSRSSRISADKGPGDLRTEVEAGRGGLLGTRGFTIIEVIVSVAVSAIIVVALYATFFGVFRATDATEAGLEKSIEAGRFVDRFSRDVRSAILKAGDPASRFSGEKREGRSVISFASISRPVIVENTQASDLTGVRYFVDDAGEGGLFREAWDLFRGEKTRVELLRGVDSFEVLFYNGRDWAAAWDSDLEGRLPRAIKMELVLADGEKVSAIARLMLR